MVTIANLKTLFPLSLDEETIEKHLNRASWDYKDLVFEDELQELEVVGCKALYYLAPLLYSEMQNRANEFSESLDRFKDVVSFGNVWLNRSNTALNKTNNDEKDEVSYRCI